jgi:hypothetical protein
LAQYTDKNSIFRKAGPQPLSEQLRGDPLRTQFGRALNELGIEPGSQSTVGKQAIAAEDEKFHAQYPEFKVLKYAPFSTEVQIAGGWAIDLGNADASYRMSAKDEPVGANEKGVIRVLKRQSDGSWKFAVVGLK